MLRSNFYGGSMTINFNNFDTQFAPKTIDDVVFKDAKAKQTIEDCIAKMGAFRALAKMASCFMEMWVLAKVLWQKSCQI